MGNYQVKQIDAGTWQLQDPFRTYLYLIEGKDRAVLLDAGNGFSGLREAVASLTDKPVEVILTHGHFDHTGCSGEFSSCRIHPEDEAVLKSGFERTGRQKQMAHFSQIYDYPLSREEENYLVTRTMPDKLTYLTDGEPLDLGGRKLSVISTPGHTRGSVCFLDTARGYLFSGDTACNREILVYFDHSATVEDVKASDERLLSMEKEYRKIWPGHHECPLDSSVLRDYIYAADQILENPNIGEKVNLDLGYKLLYSYKSIGISYVESHVYRN